MMPLHSRRLLFVQQRRIASLAPIHVAMIVLAGAALLALLVAFAYSPNGKAGPAAYTEAQGRMAPAGGLAEGVLRVPAESRRPGSRTRSI